VGETFDELVLETTDKVFSSGAGLPSHGRNYRDYGLFSTFPVRAIISSSSSPARATPASCKPRSS
jgi:hypothetical protein